MSDLNQPNDVLSGIQEKPKLPGSLNVLTILTFIGCGIQLCFTFGMFAFFGWAMKQVDKAREAGNLSDKQLADMEKGQAAMDKLLANKTAIIITSVIGIALCFYGAMMMRKLKKEGFYVYVLGHVVPLVSGLVLLGFATQFNGAMSYVFGLFLPILFIVLYSTNLKHLK